MLPVPPAERRIRCAWDATPPCRQLAVIATLAGCSMEAAQAAAAVKGVGTRSRAYFATMRDMGRVAYHLGLITEARPRGRWDPDGVVGMAKAYSAEGRCVDYVLVAGGHVWQPDWPADFPGLPWRDWLSWAGMRSLASVLVPSGWVHGSEDDEPEEA